jgi:hypothetical protein
VPELRPPILLCRSGGDEVLTIALLVLSEALFLWMFLAAAPLEQLAAAGAFGNGSETRLAAFAFAASWRHGMAGNSPLYMPGFFAVAVAVWLWLDGAKAVSARRYFGALLAAGAIAAVTAAASRSLVPDAFESATGLSVSGPVPAAGPSAVFMGFYTLLTWTLFVVGCRLALHWRTLLPLLPVIPMTAGLAVLRPWTVDVFTNIWWHRATAGDLVAVFSLIMVPATAAWLYRHIRTRFSIQLTPC